MSEHIQHSQDVILVLSAASLEPQLRALHTYWAGCAHSHDHHMTIAYLGSGTAVHGPEQETDNTPAEVEVKG